MATRDPDQLVVGASGDVWVAPVGTALPTTEAAALNGLFAKLGYITEDGITFSDSKDIQEIKAWQSLAAVRRVLVGRETTASFALQQWNDDNFVFAFGGGESTEPTSGHFKYTPPLDTDALDEKAMILEWVDGSKNYRLVIPRGTVTEAVEFNIVRTDAAPLPIGFKALTPEDGSAPWYLLDNDPAFTPLAS